MKRFLTYGLALLIACTTFIFSSCGGGSKSTPSNPVEYSNKMMMMVNGSSTTLTALKTAIKSGDYAKANEALSQYVAYLDKSIEEVSAMGDYKGDSALKDAIITTLNGYKSAGDDYKKIIDMYSAADQGQDLDSAAESATWNSIQTKLQTSGNSMNAALEKFQASL